MPSNQEDYDPRQLSSEEAAALEYRIHLLTELDPEQFDFEGWCGAAYMQGCVETIIWIIKGPIGEPNEILHEAARRFAGVVASDLDKARFDPRDN